VRQFGIRGCVSRMAQEFGDHPEAAADRMRWVRRLADQVFASPSRSGQSRWLAGPPDRYSLMT
jgi:hypothetical protein